MDVAGPVNGMTSITIREDEQALMQQFSNVEFKYVLSITAFLTAERRNLA